jgi:choline dehydrogenase-like flavoprotein
MLRQTRRLGGIVVPPMLQLAEPGRGFHSGGSFPMRSQPKKFESDSLGRPHGWSRVHAVDASVLPSIPATTVTFSVMANAHRIGWETANNG